MGLLDSCRGVVQALKAKSEAFVIDSQAVEDGCVEVTYVDRIAGDVVAVVIRLSVDMAGLDASSGLHMVKHLPW